MSRIDEALRRLGQPAAPGEPVSETAAASAAGDADSPAVNPWGFGAPAEGTVAVPPPHLKAEAAALRPSVASERLVTGATTVLPVEQYRKVAASLHHLQADRGLRIVMVTSALPREGKTLTSVNLSLTFSESYRRRVLLVDADLRRPSVHEAFGVANATGLSDGLSSSGDQRLTLAQVSPTLTVLTGGRPVVDPMHMISSERMHRILHEASQNFDWVVVDTPPVAMLPDAHVLAAMVDGIVLVVQAGVTPFPAVQRAVETVGRDRILGVILNGVEGSQAHYHHDYDYRYGDYGPPPART